MYRFLSELSRNFSELKKYKFYIIFANLQIFILAYGLTEYIFVQNKNLIFFMLIIWYYTTHGISYPTYIVEEEIMDRTVMSIFQSKTSLLRVIVQRCIAMVLMDTIKVIPLFTIFYFMGQFEIFMFQNFHWILIVILISIITSYGLGIFLAGLALVFKRITNFISLTEYYVLFFGGITIDLSNKLLNHINKVIFPYITAKSFINNILDGVFGFHLMCILIVQCILLTIFAVLFFNFMLNKSITGGELYGI